MKIAILGSTRGTSAQAIFEAVQDKRIPATIDVVVSNRADAQILERARFFHVPAKWLDSSGLSREAYDAQVTQLLQSYHIDLIVLVGYLRILSKAFIEQWQGRVINVHPSLLPAFAGKMDLAVHQAVIASGNAETGCTVHVVTEEVDAGPILIQKKCQVQSTDTAELLKAKVQILEGEALVEAIAIIQQQGFTVPEA